MGTRLVVIGIVLGVAGAYAASQVLSTLLFGVQSTDATTYVFAVIPMIAAALVASIIPARRAARIDPMITIQHRD